MKKCSRCQTEKPRTEFYGNKTQGDGLQSYCKPCASVMKGYHLGDKRRAAYQRGVPCSLKVRGAWLKMWARVEGRSASSKRNYTDRGITACDRWKSLQNFFDDMGEPPSPNHSLDRINNDGNYEPGNCRWATAQQQAWNTRVVTKVDFLGEQISSAEALARLGVKCKARNSLVRRFKNHQMAVDLMVGRAIREGRLLPSWQRRFVLVGAKKEPPPLL